jgi:hypothetical protein
MTRSPGRCAAIWAGWARWRCGSSTDGEDVTVEEPPADKQTDFITFFEELTGQELSEEDPAELAEMMDGGN